MSFDSPGAHFTHDHRRCDELWAELESVAEQPAAAKARFAEFEVAMRAHFAMEEEVLFPALEDATGMHGMGPTYIMRMEHAQMKNLLEQMAADAARGAFDAVLDQGDTLLMLIQQHNVKEENILYPLADRALGGDWPELEKKLGKYGSK